MDTTLRKYKDSDFETLKRYMEELQDHLIEADDLKRLRRLPEYGESYTKRFIEKVKKHQGQILLAEKDGKAVGCIGAIIEKQTREDLLEAHPSKTGRIIELIISKDHRSQNIGKILIEQIEIYLKEEGCDTLRVEVLASNKIAHEFYKRNGYSDRMIDMIKKSSNHESLNKQ
jgi:ribosomal protein S18 acetylase RimI-like enzyme